MSQSNQELNPEDMPEVLRLLLSIDTFMLSTRDDGMLQISERPDPCVFSCSGNAK